MNWQIVKNDLRRNKIINLALLLFMIFSACLAVLSAVMAVQTVTSISGLYRTAQPPHFLQMHKGSIDPLKIEGFMSGYDGVTSWQTVTMLDVYGENLTAIGDEGPISFSDCRLDIGLVRQNKERDLLLDGEHQIVTLEAGEIGMPVLLKDMYGLEMGDRVILSGNSVNQEFVIREFVLDALMNSPMCSSTRILVSDADYHSLSGRIGEPEYLIEAYFTEEVDAQQFQTAYENGGLPQKGQAVTSAVIFLLSALTDMTTVFVLLLVSILLIFVSFICIRFTILASLEEEIFEIGTMKAIGLPYAEIRELYLSKYRVLAAAGVTIGYLLAMLLSRLITRHISAAFGGGGFSSITLAASLLAAVLVFFLINYYYLRLLRKIKYITVVDALVRGTGFEQERGRVRDGLYQSGKVPVNWLMAWREVFYQFKKWAVVFAVAVIAVLMVLVPFNLMHTFDSPEFITYMGSSREDILIEVENGDQLEAGFRRVMDFLQKDPAISGFYAYRSVTAQTEDEESRQINLHVDCGTYAGQGLRYLSGRAPQGSGEIALSYLNAGKNGKNTGDTITLNFAQREQAFTVSGIYQDVTSGGYTAKAKYDFPELTAEKYAFSVNLNDPARAGEVADRWSEILAPGVSVDPMEEFIAQTLGGVVRQLRTVILAVAVISAILAMLITSLFLKLRLAKDLTEIAILKAIGFSARDIKKQYLMKIGLVSLAGVMTGVLLTGFLGERMVNAALSLAGIGLKQVALMADPLIQYLLCPLTILALMLMVTWMVVREIDQYNMMAIVNE